MIILHNGKRIGVNPDVVKKMTEKEFIKLHKHLNFSDKELSVIYLQTIGKESDNFFEQ